MPGKVRVYSRDHEWIEERHYYTWEGARNIVEVLIKKHDGKDRYIQVVPTIKLTNAEVQEFNRIQFTAYNNIPVYDYEERKNGHGK